MSFDPDKVKSFVATLRKTATDYQAWAKDDRNNGREKRAQEFQNAADQNLSDADWWEERYL